MIQTPASGTRFLDGYVHTNLYTVIASQSTPLFYLFRLAVSPFLS
jgi:hypothetical protein